MTMTLPFKRYLAVLSGLSVEIISGMPKAFDSTNNCSNSPADSKESISKLFKRYLTSLTKSELVIFFM